jgi:hypothetical protein
VLSLMPEEFSVKYHASIRLLALLAAALSAAVSEGRAAAPSGVCYSACVQGTGGTCGTPAEQEAQCIQAGCDGALAGCVENWGNCQGGYRIQCNSYQQ